MFVKCKKCGCIVELDKGQDISLQDGDELFCEDCAKDIVIPNGAVTQKVVGTVVPSEPSLSSVNKHITTQYIEVHCPNNHLTVLSVGDGIMCEKCGYKFIFTWNGKVHTLGE
jgi:DNA-directed RNA polymerase subunit RPC12/RpoP